jgi:hypothetical protein
VLTIADDGPLVVTRRRLADAVSALADPIPVCVGGGVYRWVEPLYVQLRQALQGTPVSVRRAGTHRSRAPCRTDVLTLLIEIDTTVAAWEPHGKSTVERLHELAGRGWRPQDCELLDGYTAYLEHWCLAGTELLGTAPRVFLHVPCPQCGTQFAYRAHDGGERVRVRALRVSETGCQCAACGAFWGPELFEWLARLMGCAALPA